MEYLNDFVQAWQDLRAQPYADTLLVAGGALLTLLAVIRIVRSSLAMLLWVLLAGVGLAAVMHGSGRAPWESRSLAGVELEELVGPGGEYSRDVLELLCIRLEESRGARRASALPGPDGT